MTITANLWLAYVIVIAACLIGFGAGVLAMMGSEDSGRGGQASPPPRRSPAPRPDYVILEPATSPMRSLAAWRSVPPPVLASQRAQLDQLEREVNVLAAEAWRLNQR